MTVEKYIKIVLPLTAAGIIFAGYMTGVKWFSGTCAFNETCPELFGQPTCFYGLIIFSAMFAVALSYRVRKQYPIGAVRTVLGLSLVGGIFSAVYAVPEIANLISGGSDYMLGMPTCAYGMFFYLVIIIFTFFSLLKIRNGMPATDVK
jgi:hypothetical protein